MEGIAYEGLSKSQRDRLKELSTEANELGNDMENMSNELEEIYLQLDDDQKESEEGEALSAAIERLRAQAGAAAIIEQELGFI